MIKLITRLKFILIFLTFTSCAKDLPQVDPESEITRAIHKAQVSEARAKAALEAARLERQKSEGLFAEARRISELNQKRCEVRCRAEVRKPAKIPTKRKSLEAPQQQDSPVIKDPEYSPSDAPLGWQSK